VRYLVSLCLLVYESACLTLRMDEDSPTAAGRQAPRTHALFRNGLVSHTADGLVHADVGEFRTFSLRNPSKGDQVFRLSDSSLVLLKGYKELFIYSQDYLLVSQQTLAQEVSFTKTGLDGTVIFKDLSSSKVYSLGQSGDLHSFTATLGSDLFIIDLAYFDNNVYYLVRPKLAGLEIFWLVKVDLSGQKTFIEIGGKELKKLLLVSHESILVQNSRHELLRFGFRRSADGLKPEGTALLQTTSLKGEVSQLVQISESELLLAWNQTLVVLNLKDMAKATVTELEEEILSVQFSAFQERGLVLVEHPSHMQLGHIEPDKSFNSHSVIIHGVDLDSPWDSLITVRRRILVGCTNCASCNGLGTDCLACNSQWGKGTGGVTPNCDKDCTAYHASRCLYCNNTRCLTCTSNYSSLHACGCAPGFWDDGTVCQPCDPSCATCSIGNLPTHCTGCPSHYYLLGAAPNACAVCDANCKECHTNPTNCYKCIADWGLTGSPTETCTPCLGNECKVIGTEYCQVRTSPCTKCKNTVTFCTECDSTRFLVTPIGICSLECLGNTFYNHPTDTCVTCHPSCLTCSASTAATDCTSCPPGYIFRAGVCEALPICLPTEYMTYLTTCASCTYPIDFCGRDSGFYIGGYIPGTYLTSIGLGTLHANCATGASNSAAACLTCTIRQLHLNKCLPKCQDAGFNAAETCIGPSTSACQINMAISADSTNCVDCLFKFKRSRTIANTCVPDCLRTEVVSAASCIAGQPKCKKMNPANTLCIKCTLGYYLSAGSCLSCHGTCRTCTGASSNACLSCYATYSLDSGVCVHRCPEEQYWDTTTAQCSPCLAAHCLNCLGSNPSLCLACKPGFFPDDDQACVSPCADGQFYSQLTSACEPCASPCTTCALSANRCLSCEFVGYTHDEATNSCLPIVCHASCLTCFGTLDSHCVTFNTGYELSFSNTPAVHKPPTCQFGSYWNTATLTCDPCHSSCQWCTGPLTTNCTMCASGRFFWSGICTTNPNDCQLYQGQTIEATTEACIPCASPNCLQCSAQPDLCDFCIHGMVPDNLKTCIACPNDSSNDRPTPIYCKQQWVTTVVAQACPVGYRVAQTGFCARICPYKSFTPSSTSDICSPCHATCLTCAGAAAENCISCSPMDYLYKLNSTYIFCIEAKDKTGDNFYSNIRCPLPSLRCTSATVHLSCIDGYWLNGNTCTACSNRCMTCLSATHCLSCFNDYAYDSVLKTCTHTCRPYEFYDSVTFQCKICNPNCKSCHLNQNGLNCMSCYQGMYLTNVMGNGVCKACHPSCLTCASAASNDCDTCHPDFVYDSGTRSCSRPPCEAGHYRDYETGKCLWCFKYCATCTGAGPHQCSTCISPYALVDPVTLMAVGAGPGFCKKICPAGSQYTAKYPNECQTCHPDCLTCSLLGSPTACLSCPDGSYLEGTRCVECHHWCKTCSKESRFSCLSCYPSYSLLATGYCQLMPLVTKFYHELETNEYLPCHANCAECSGPGIHQCTSCVVGRITRPLDNYCVIDCGIGEYYSEETQLCHSCHHSCFKCFFGSEFDCDVCKQGKLRRLDNSCQDTCLSNNFIYQPTQSCQNCHDTCATCNGPDPNQCLSCDSTKFLLKNGTCDAQCPPFSFVLPDPPGNHCEDCYKTCETCSGSGSSHCLSCKKPEIVMLSPEGVCLDCLENPELDEKTCHFSVILILMKPSASGVDPKASLSLRVSFRNESAYYPKLNKQILMDSLQVSIQDLEPKDFSYEIEKVAGEIILNLYFEKMVTETKLLTLSPKKEIILVNEITKKTLLIFRKRPAEYSIEIFKKPNQLLMDSLSTFQTNSRVVTIVISTLSMVMAFLVVVSSSGLGAPIMKFFRVFKLISRLKLVNIYYGAYLEIFLVIAGNLYKLGGDEIYPRAMKFGANSKGKLKFYKVTVIAIDKLAIPYAIFFTLIAMRIYNQFISKYIKSVKEYSFTDSIVHKICDKARMVILTVIGIDIIFYSMHCVAHLELRTWYYHRDPAISLILSIVAIVAVLSEFLGLLAYANLTKFLSKKKEVRRNLKYKHLFEIDKEHRKEAKDGSKGANESSKGAIDNRNHLLRIDDHTEIQDAASPGQNSQILLGSPNRPSKNSLSSQNEEEQAALSFAGFDPSQPNKKLKLPLMSNTSMEEFMSDGIKVDKLHTFTGRYSNIFSLMRLFSFEPIFVGLQMFPGAQLVLLTTIELAYIVFLVKAGFKDKIYISKLAFIDNLINEMSIIAFVSVGLFFHFGGGQRHISEAVWDMLQYVVIGFIALSVLVGLVSLLASIIMVVINGIKGRELKKFIDELRKQRELEKLVSRRRVFADPVAPKKISEQNLKDIDFYGLTEEEILWHVSRGNIELQVAQHLVARKYNQDVNLSMPVFNKPVQPVEVATVKRGNKRLVALQPRAQLRSQEMSEGPERLRQEEYERKEREQRRRERIEKHMYRDLF
jgi:hypothetical protein